MITRRIRKKACKSATNRQSRAFFGKRNGFTLIELLAVIAIISVIASLVIGVARMAKLKAKVSKAEADIQLIHNAIEDYRLDIGIYPDSISNIVSRLPSRVDIIDPWEREYVYRFRNENSYTLHSEGPDETIPADNVPRR